MQKQGLTEVICIWKSADSEIYAVAWLNKAVPVTVEHDHIHSLYIDHSGCPVGRLR